MQAALHVTHLKRWSSYWLWDRLCLRRRDELAVVIIIGVVTCAYWSANVKWTVSVQVSYWFTELLSMRQVQSLDLILMFLCSD